MCHSRGVSTVASSSRLHLSGPTPPSWPGAPIGILSLLNHHRRSEPQGSLRACLRRFPSCDAAGISAREPRSRIPITQLESARALMAAQGGSLPFAEPKTIRFLLTVLCHEYLRAFRSGIASRIRRPCESGAAGDQNDRGACGQRPRQRCLEEGKCYFDVGLPVDGELLPALLV